MTNTLEQDIAKLRDEAKRKPKKSLNADYRDGLAYGRGSMAIKAIKIIEELQAEIVDIKKRAADDDMNRQFQVREKVLEILHLRKQLQIAVNCLKLFASTGHVDAITTLGQLNHDK